jgi:hypothetical protein
MHAVHTEHIDEKCAVLRPQVEKPLPYAVHAMVPNLWFANLLKFGKVFQGVR